MPSFMYPYGPQEIFCRFREGDTQYLGTCVTASEVEARPAFIPIMNDLTGRSVPMQLVKDGEQHIVSMVLNRYDELVFQGIREGFSLIPGFDNILDRGSLFIGVNDVELIIVNTFAGTIAAPITAPLGRRYYSATLKGWRASTVGTRVNELALVWECNGVFNPIDRSNSLYTETDLGTLVPIS